MFNRYAFGLLYSLAEYSLSRTRPLQETHTHTHTNFCREDSQLGILFTSLIVSTSEHQSQTVALPSPISLPISVDACLSPYEPNVDSVLAANYAACCVPPNYSVLDFRCTSHANRCA